MPIQNIRVKVNRKYSQIYRDLTSDKQPIRKIPAFEQHRDLFVLCCCVGFRDNKKNPIDKTEDLFWSHSMDSYQETVLRAIALKSAEQNDLTLVNNDQEIMRISEGYADRGMEILIEKTLSPYLKEEAGKLSVEYNDKSFIQKDILALVQSEFTKSPFDY